MALFRRKSMPAYYRDGHTSLQVSAVYDDSACKNILFELFRYDDLMKRWRYPDGYV